MNEIIVVSPVPLRGGRSEKLRGYLLGSPRIGTTEDIYHGVFPTKAEATAAAESEFKVYLTHVKEHVDPKQRIELNGLALRMPFWIVRIEGNKELFLMKEQGNEN